MKKHLTIALVMLSLLIGFGVGFIVGSKSADLNIDGKVDKLDFNIMMQQWSK